MLIVCKCLNVSIDAKDGGNTDASSLGLSPEEEADSFFKEALKKVEVVSMAVQVKSLLQSKAVGCWVVEHCLNCSTSCLSKRSDGSLALANASLVSHPDVVEKMKSYKDYSPVFRIIIEPLAMENNLNSSTDSRQSRQKVQVALTTLQQQVNEVIRDQATKTDEIIRSYTEQQYDLLEEFRDRAIRDHKALAQKVYEAQTRLEGGNVAAYDGAESDSLVEIVSTPPNKKLLQKKKSEPLSREPRQVSSRGSSESFPKNSSTATNSLDSEGLFVLEGMEDSPENEPVHSEGDSDSDHDDSGSHDEGIDVHRKRLPSFHMAKSLPVNVPVYSVTSLTDFENDERENRGTVDIAASIKALARSVHGDAIFGDLPRPRFSTLI